MDKILLTGLLACLAAVSCSRTESMDDLTERVFTRASEQFALLDANLDEAGFSEDNAL